MIKEICLKEKGKDPIEIVKKMMHNPEVSIHGPEHHILDGAALMTALHNGGMEFNLEEALDEMERRGCKMPGATCGQWGMCGSCSSVGAAVAIIRETGPLSGNEYYKDNLRITSEALGRIADVGGPRCCKRNAFLAISTAAEYMNEKYDAGLETGKITCEFSRLNKQCIKERCPYYEG